MPCQLSGARTSSFRLMWVVLYFLAANVQKVNKLLKKISLDTLSCSIFLLSFLQLLLQVNKIRFMLLASTVVRIGDLFHGIQSLLHYSTNYGFPTVAVKYETAMDEHTFFVQAPQRRVRKRRLDTGWDRPHSRPATLLSLGLCTPVCRSEKGRPSGSSFEQERAIEWLVFANTALLAVQLSARWIMHKCDYVLHLFCYILIRAWNSRPTCVESVRIEDFLGVTVPGN